VQRNVNRQWLVNSRPEGVLREDNFQWVERRIPSPEEGQVLVRNLWLSFDPTQRGWMSRDSYVPMIPLGDVMRAASVGQVVESRHPEYKCGEFVQGAFGWQDYVATDGGGIIPMRRVPPGVPPNLALSLFGITGPTAYFGVLDVGQVKAGETFVVSGAAGATGSVAGQIAKIKGCRVIGTAGGMAKCDWLKNEAGFDDAIDYRSENIGTRLLRSAQMASMCSSTTSAAWYSTRLLPVSGSKRGSSYVAQSPAIMMLSQRQVRPIISTLRFSERGWKGSSCSTMLEGFQRRLTHLLAG
jgi:NADPH-dependent curcumin reductase